MSTNQYEAIGGFLDFYIPYIYLIMAELCDTLGSNPFQLKDQDYQNYAHYISVLKKINAIDIHRITQALNLNARKSKALQGKK